MKSVFRSALGLTFLVVASLVLVVRSGVLVAPWFEGPKIEFRSGKTGDVRVDGGSAFGLGDQPNSEFVLIDEFSETRSFIRTAKIPAKMRDWRETPKRPNLLIKNGEFLVFFGESFDKEISGKRGLVILDPNFAYGFVPIGQLEEMAEGRDRVIVEAVEGTKPQKRSLFWFSAASRTYERIPDIGAGQDVRSLIPTLDGGFLAFVQFPEQSGWFRFRNGKWSRVGQSSPDVTVSLLADWSGGRGMVLMGDGSVGDLRMVKGSPWLIRYGKNASSQNVGGLLVKGRVVLSDLSGQLIPTDRSLGYVMVAKGQPR